MGTDANKGKLSVLWEGFTRMIVPKTNFRLNRFYLQKYKQAESESVDEYMTRCKLQAKCVRFRDACETNARLVEQLIVGIKHPQVHDHLLGRDADLTLDGATATMSDMQLFKGTLNTSVSRQFPITRWLHMTWRLSNYAQWLTRKRFLTSKLYKSANADIVVGSFRHTA